MKISFFMPLLQVGGIERIFITYANLLTKRGCVVEFVVCIEGGELESLLIPEVKVVGLGGIKLRNALFPLRTYLKENKPDFLITGSNLQNFVCTLACKGLKTKVVISQHNYFDVDVKNLGWWSRFEQKAIKVMYPHADLILAVSNGIKNYLVNDLGVKKEVHVLYNPIDITETLTRSKEHIDTVPDSYIVFVGRLSPVKNLDLLLDAFEKTRVNDCSLVIVGDGLDGERIRRKAANYTKNEKIIFTGVKDNPLPYISNARALVLCSFSEALPTILLEAMVLNTPIVATPTKGALEILKDVDNTFISKSFDDSVEFSKLLEEACATKVDTKSSAEKYDSDTVIEQFVKLLKSVY